MKSILADKTVLVYDNGTYVELAVRLAREAGRSLYYLPWKGADCSTHSACIGGGLEGVERVRDFWDVVDEVDLFVFPDVLDGDLQVALEGMGKRVWGSRKGEQMELRRLWMKEQLKAAGLPVAPFVKVTGTDKLREYLQRVEDVYVKLGNCSFRSEMETWHHQNYTMSEPKLDALEYLWGPLKRQMVFLVEEGIKTRLEGGYDGYSVDGRFPKVAAQGYEQKWKSYLQHFQPYEELPEEVRETNDKLAGLMRKLKYRGAFHSEIRVTPAGKAYPIDFTCRYGTPAGEAFWENARNLGEIFWAGAEGELVEMDLEAEFAAQVMLNTDCGGFTATLEIPEKVRRWVKLYNCYQADGAYHVTPTDVTAPNIEVKKIIGSVLGLGKSLQEAIDQLKEHAGELRGFDLEMPLQSLAEGLAEIHEAQRKGMKFTDKRVPRPETVMG